MINLFKKKEVPPAPLEEKSIEVSRNIMPHNITLPEPQNAYLDLEKRLSIVEIKLYELRTLLLEQDYKKQNKLSGFGKRIRRFSV